MFVATQKVLMSIQNKWFNIGMNVNFVDFIDVLTLANHSQNINYVKFVSDSPELTRR